MHDAEDAQFPAIADLAFRGFRKEVAPVRSAMAALIAQRTSLDISGYSEMFREILRASAVTANMLKDIGKFPYSNRRLER